VLYNFALALPRGESLEMVQIASGVGHRLSEEQDPETLFRLVLTLCQLTRNNTPAAILIKSLDLPLRDEAVLGVVGEKRRMVATELCLMLDAVVDDE